MRFAFLANAHLSDLAPVAKRFTAASLAAGPLLDAGLSATGRRDVAARLRRFNLSPGVILAKLPTKRLLDDLDQSLSLISDAAQLARGIGFDTVAIHLVQLPTEKQAEPVPTESPAPSGLILPSADDIAKLVGQSTPAAVVTSEGLDALRLIAALADRMTTRLAIGASLLPTASLAAALQTVDSPMLFRDLDPAASLEDLQSDVETTLGSLPPAIHIRATDAHAAGGRSTRTEVGDGDVPWREVIEASEVDSVLTFAGALTTAVEAKGKLQSDRDS